MEGNEFRVQCSQCALEMLIKIVLHNIQIKIKITFFLYIIFVMIMIKNNKLYIACIVISNNL